MATKQTLADKLKSFNSGAGLGPLRQFKAIYSFAQDGGADALITPNQNVLLPKNATIVGVTINPTLAPVGAGASIAFGTSAGSSASSLLAATAITSLTINSLVQGVPTLAVPLKLSAAGYLTLTPSAALLTAGVIEITGWYYVSNA